MYFIIISSIYKPYSKVLRSAVLETMECIVINLILTYQGRKTVLKMGCEGNLNKYGWEGGVLKQMNKSKIE